MRQRKTFFNLTQFWFKTESMNRNTDGLKIEKKYFSSVLFTAVHAVYSQYDDYYIQAFL